MKGEAAINMWRPVGDNVENGGIAGVKALSSGGGEKAAENRAKAKIMSAAWQNGVANGKAAIMAAANIS